MPFTRVLFGIILCYFIAREFVSGYNCSLSPEKCNPDDFLNSTSPSRNSQRFKFGKFVAVKCCVNPKFSVEWYYQKTDFNKNSWEIITQYDKRFRTTTVCYYPQGEKKIIFFVALDAGMHYFRCEVKNPNGTIIGHHMTEVCGYEIQDFNETVSGPEIVTSENAAKSQDFARVGESISITCNARIGYHSEGTMYWSRRSNSGMKNLSHPVSLTPDEFHELVEESKDSQFMITTTRNKNACGFTMQSVLTIKNIQHEDFGEYICHVKNKNSMKEFSFPLENKEADPLWELVLGSLFGSLLFIAILLIILYKLRFPILYRMRRSQEGYRRHESIVIFHCHGIEDEDIELANFLNSIARSLENEEYETYLQYRDKNVSLPALENISNSLESQPLTVFFISQNSLDDSILNFAFDEVDHFRNKGLPMLVLIAISKREYQKEMKVLTKQKPDFYSAFFSRFKAKYRSNNLFDPSKCYFCSPKSSNNLIRSFELNDILNWIKYHSYQKENITPLV